MPLKISSKFGSRTRRFFASALLAAFVLSTIFVTAGGPPAQAQRKGKQGASQSSNDNASAPKTERPKRVFVGGSSSTPQGSRVTIKSDNPLNDYSAYRSGDRFYVVVPGANAGSVAKGASGRGFSDMQVQQRGKDVVLSYRVQPGAKPKVEQKFNRLDVVFEAAEGAPAQQDNSRASKPPANQNPVANTPPPNQTTTPAQSQSAAERNAGRNVVAGTSETNAATPSAGTTTPPSGVAEAPTQTALPPIAEQSPVQTPAETIASAEQQIAQAQPPTAAAPITTTTQPAAQTGTSIGAVVLRNWPLALTLALLVVGVGLFFAARRTSSAATDRDPQTETGAKLKDASATSSTAETKRAAETSAAVAAATLAASKAGAASDSQGAKQKKEDKKKQHKGRASEESPAVVQEAAASSKTASSATETTATTALESTETVAQEAALTSSIAALSSSAAAPTESAPAAEATAEVAKGIEPAVSLEGDVVQTETRRLLDGEPFDERVVGTSDVLARQMIASELLSALAARNPERRERARSAFLSHGYFDEALKDLGAASAPAERASAARSLGLSGEYAATPQLVAALEDPAVEVRRAAVEALASLRDPSAVAPLEALLEREKKSKTKVNRKLVQHAVDACREGFAEPTAAADMLAVETTSDAESISALEAATNVEEAAPFVEEIEQAPATETAPELLVTEDASVETVAPETAVEEVTSEEVTTIETEIDPAPVEEATRELAPVEDEVVVEEPAVAEEPAAVEETTASEAPATFEPAPLAAFSESALVRESPIKDFELWGDEEETPTVEAAPVQTTTATVEVEDVAEVSEPRAFEETSHAAEVEEFTLTPPPAETAPALEAESLAPVSEVKGIEALRESEPSLPFAGTVGEDEGVTSEVEHAEVAELPGDVRETEALEESPAVSVAETGLEPVGGEGASDWIELDMSEAATPARTFEQTAPIFETSGGDTLSDAAVPAARVEAETRVSEYAAAAPPEVETGFADEQFAAPAAPAVAGQEKSVELFDEFSTVPASIQQRLVSGEPEERAGAILELSRLDTSEAFHQICAAFDDEAREVRSAAARALYGLREDRAESFTRALRESDADRRRNIGTAISASGLASEAIGQLTGESRERTYEAFSLLFLMAKAGEVQPLIRAIEGHPNSEVRLAVVKLLALSGQKEVLPAFRRLAVRGSLPTEVRSAVMEAIYQISSSGQPDPTHAA